MDRKSRSAGESEAAKKARPRLAGCSRTSKPVRKTAKTEANTEKEPFDEREIVRRAQQNDLIAMDELYNYYVDGVYRYFYRRSWNISLSQEGTGETFRRVFEYIGQFRWQGKHFSSWIYGIAQNVFLEQLRELKKAMLTEPLDDQSISSSNSEAFIDANANILESLIWKEQRDALWLLVAELSLEYQSVITMRVVYNLSYAEIAMRNGGSEGAWKQKHHRALVMLRQKIGESNLWEDIGGGYA